MLAILVTAALWAAEPVVVHVPAEGYSERVAIAGPGGPLLTSFGVRSDGGGHIVTVWMEADPAAWEAAAGGSWAAGPDVPAGRFVTGAWVGDLWKCQPLDATWVEAEAWPADVFPLGGLVAARPLTGPAWARGDRTWAATTVLEHFQEASEATWAVQFDLPGQPPQTVRLVLERPLALSATEAEILRQYQRVGPAMLRRSAGAVSVHRIARDLCGESRAQVLEFDAGSLETLAWPTPTHRMVTAHGWVFVEELPDVWAGPVSPPGLDRVDASRMTFLGDTYSREPGEVRVAPGTASATFTLGDFAGCFGAGCGDPVNQRDAVVTWKDGSLSTRIVRAAEP